MTRAPEFCWIAEQADGKNVRAIYSDRRMEFTTDPEMALRITTEGRKTVVAAHPTGAIGFRKVLVG